MFRGGLPGGGASAAAVSAESLKRQFNPEGNGLSMNLQDQYNEHEAEQQAAAKRQRMMAGVGGGGGMGGGDFGGGGGGPGLNSFGVGGPGGGLAGDAPGASAGGMGVNSGGGADGPGLNSNSSVGGGATDAPGGVGGGGMAGGHNSANGGANAMGSGNNNSSMNGAMSGMSGAGMNMNMMGMNPMANMNPMMNMGPMNMNMMNLNGAMNPMMNPMNMAAARSGLGGAGGAAGFSHLNSLNPMGMNGSMDNELASALFQDPAARMAMLGQRGGGLGFAAMQGAAGHGLGGLLPSAAGGNPFGDYRLTAAQNPYAGLGPAGFNQAGGPGAGMNAAGMGNGAGAGMGLPGSRRAQLMALMDMEGLPQEASKVTSGFSGGAGAGAEDAAWAAQRSPMGGLGGAAGAGRRDAQEPDGATQATGPTQPPEPPMDIPTFSTASTQSVLPLPPVIEEGAAPHYSQRAHIPLGIDEDNNWLTEFQCFIRFDLIEVVQASRHVDQMTSTADGSKATSGGETFQQVGVRCRYCAHLHPGQRASRSSAFPSSIRQLYQSFTMMLRDHFEQCSEIPIQRKKWFSELKAKNSQGAYDSKQYWIYAAEKLGMMDSEHGIQMTAESQATARRKPPFGTVGSTPHTHAPPKLLVSPEDLRITSDFLYTLMSQVQVVHLIDSERVGKRKTLRVGLPGFGCRYCCHVGRCGLSRMFPLRRRMLPGKVNEIYEHVKRCTLFPTKEKDLLSQLKDGDKTSPEQEKEFFDRIWERLGCESEVKK